MMDLDADENVLYELLKAKRDNQGIVRYTPSEVETELSVLGSQLEERLNRLYTRGVLVYVTRTNKETGEMLKIVQLIEEEVI